jgi:hypothetical protein
MDLWKLISSRLASLKKSFTQILLLFLFSLFVSCALTATRPKIEMSLAASAFLAAQEAKAHILAPGLFRKAEVFYIKAKSAYRRKYFSKAKQFATLSQKFAEQAEFLAVKKATLEGTETDEGPSSPDGPASPPSPEAPKEGAATTPPPEAD